MLRGQMMGGALVGGDEDGVEMGDWLGEGHGCEG